MKIQKVLENHNAELISASTSFSQEQNVLKDREDSGLRVILKVRMNPGPGGISLSNLQKELPYGFSVMV
jgi:hypothetical protein